MRMAMITPITKAASTRRNMAQRRPKAITGTARKRPTIDRLPTDSQRALTHGSRLRKQVVGWCVCGWPNALVHGLGTAATPDCPRSWDRGYAGLPPLAGSRLPKQVVGWTGLDSVHQRTGPRSCDRSYGLPGSTAASRGLPCGFDHGFHGCSATRQVCASRPLSRYFVGLAVVVVFCTATKSFLPNAPRSLLDSGCVCDR